MFRRSVIFFVIAVFVSVLGYAGVGDAAMFWAKSSREDKRIESSAKKSKVFKTVLKDDRIMVESRDGVVILTGAVADKAHKELAGETVAKLSGVKIVNNQLKIEGEQTDEYSEGKVSVKW